MIPRHTAASLDALALALRCKHCGRIDPRCGSKIEMLGSGGRLEIISCALASDVPTRLEFDSTEARLLKNAYGGERAKAFSVNPDGPMR